MIGWVVLSEDISRVSVRLRQRHHYVMTTAMILGLLFPTTYLNFNTFFLIFVILKIYLKPFASDG